MDTSTLEKIVVNALEDVKANDITVLDTRRLTPHFERVIVATGESNRQVNSLARNVQDEVRKAGATIQSSEGEDNGEWVLVDLGEIVVHIMQPAVRSFYNLEELWGGELPARLLRAPRARAAGGENGEPPAASAGA